MSYKSGFCEIFLILHFNNLNIPQIRTGSILRNTTRVTKGFSPGLGFQKLVNQEKKAFMEGRISNKFFLVTLNTLRHESVKIEGKINFNTMPKVV